MLKGNILQDNGPILRVKFQIFRSLDDLRLGLKWPSLSNFLGWSRSTPAILDQPMIERGCLPVELSVRQEVSQISFCPPLQGVRV